MQVEICNWGFCHDRLEALGFVQDKKYHQSYGYVTEKELMDVVKRIFDSGLNVMLKHSSDPNHIIVFVDNQGFGQR